MRMPHTCARIYTSQQCRANSAKMMRHACTQGASGLRTGLCMTHTHVPNLRMCTHRRTVLVCSCVSSKHWCHSNTWGADLRKCCLKSCDVECGPSRAPTSSSPTTLPTTLPPTRVPTAGPTEQVFFGSGCCTDFFLACHSTGHFCLAT